MHKTPLPPKYAKQDNVRWGSKRSQTETSTMGFENNKNIRYTLVCLSANALRFLQTEFPENLLGHILVLPCVARHPLELNAMKRQDWDFDNKDLKF